MKKTRIFSTMLATVICMASLPAINVFAANQQRTTTLDLTVAGFQNDQKNEDEGWSWDADTLTLTLDNVDFSTGNKSSIKVDGLKSTTILFKGENKLESSTTVIDRTGESSKDAGLTLKGEAKESKLSLVETGNLPSMDQPNIIFESGTVDIQGGAAIALYTIKVMEAAVNIDTTMADPEDGWNDGLYANGSIEIYGGEVNVKAGRIGLFVVGIGAPEPKTGLRIDGGKLDINGKLADIYVGSDNTKNAVISGGDITLGGDIGIFLYDCEKCEIKGGTFHTDECKKPFAVHKNSSAVFKYAKADYTELDQSEKAAKALNKDDYKDFSAVEKALAAIDRTKNITEQADVDAMAKAINDAVAGLEKKETPTPTPSQPDNTTSSEGSSSAPENNSDDKSSSNTDISTSSADSSSTDSSKTDNAANSNSKAASNASTTNPSTGVAGGACALALLSGAAVVMAKRKK